MVFHIFWNVICDNYIHFKLDAIDSRSMTYCKFAFYSINFCQGYLDLLEIRYWKLYSECGIYRLYDDKIYDIKMILILSVFI